MKKGFIILFVVVAFTGVTHAQIPVTDFAANLNQQIQIQQDRLHQIKELAELVNQLNTMKETLTTQRLNLKNVISIKDYKGNPLIKKGNLDLSVFSSDDANRSVEKVRKQIYNGNLNGANVIYNSTNFATGKVTKAPDRYKKYKVAETTYNEYERVISELKPKKQKLIDELKKQVTITKVADTEIEVTRAYSAILGIKVQIDYLNSQEREAYCNVITQISRNGVKARESKEARYHRVQRARRASLKNQKPVPHIILDDKVTDDGLKFDF